MVYYHRSLPGERNRGPLLRHAQPLSLPLPHSHSGGEETRSPLFLDFSRLSYFSFSTTSPPPPPTSLKVQCPFPSSSSPLPFPNPSSSTFASPFPGHPDREVRSIPDRVSRLGKERVESFVRLKSSIMFTKMGEGRDSTGRRRGTFFTRKGRESF